MSLTPDVFEFQGYYIPSMRRALLSQRVVFSAGVLLARRWCIIQKGGPSSTTVPPLSNVEGISESDKDLIRKSLANPTHNSTSRMGGEGIGPSQGDMVAAFTCTVCNTRSVKRFTKLSYTQGIVIVECPGCYNKHLLADNLGWFDDERVNIEEILRSKGEEVTRIQGSVFVEQLDHTKKTPSSSE
jgi:hypothetical protein